jgi:hypothetical protein
MDGNIVLDPRSKRRNVVFRGLLTGEQLRQIARVREDSRTVYVNPNFDESTFLSVPLFAGPKSIAGPDLTFTDARNYEWNEESQTLQIGPTVPGGPFGSFGRVQLRSVTNKATTPHCGSGGTGWSKQSGDGAALLDPYFPSPVLDRRHSLSGEHGTTVLDAYATSEPIFETPAAGLSSGATIAANLYIQTPRQITVRLAKADGTSSYSTTVNGLPGVWQRVFMWGAQSASGTTAKVEVEMDGALSGGYAVRVGPVFVCNASQYDSVPDWSDGIKTSTSLQASTGISPTQESLTVSAVVKYGPSASWHRGYVHGGIGILRLGTSALKLRWNYSNGTLEFDPTGSDSLTCVPVVDLIGSGREVAAGDFVHIVCTSRRTQRQIWVNGILVATDNTTLNGGVMDSFKRIGYGSTTQYECSPNTGLCLVRADNRVWSDEEVVRHYNLFGNPLGQNIVAQVYGRTFEIEGCDVEKWAVDGSVYMVDLTLTQTNEGRDFAPIRRTDVFA